MTEEEWIDTADPERLLEACRDRLGTRRERLVVAAICRRIQGLLIDPRSFQALHVLESYADDEATSADLNLAASVAVAVWDEAEFNKRFDEAQRYAAAAVAHGAGRVDPALWAIRTARTAITFRGLEAAVIPAFTLILRDIIGNPFRPVAADPAWRTPTVLALADAIYAERAFDRLPILADALEEAGCDHADVLSHCRGPGPHVRGCWVVDLVLGKS